MRKVVVARRKLGFSEVKMSHPFFSSSNPDTPREIGGGGEKGNRGQDSLPLVTGWGWLQAHASCSSRGRVIYRLYMHLS